MSWNASRDIKLAACAALAALLWYLPHLGARVLVTDEAKDALNIPYPHPPLLRTLMEWSQAALGFTPFAARLPVALLSAAAVGLLALWLLRRGHPRRFALIASLLFAVTPGFAVWARSGYLSAPLAFFFLIALIGAERLSRDPKDRAGDWLVFAGATLGIWSQFHGVLALPMIAWLFWKRRSALRDDRELQGFLALHALNLATFFLYVAGSPFIVNDLLTFSRVTPVAGAGPFAAIAASGRGVTYWLAVTVPVCLTFARQLGKGRDLADEAAAALFLAVSLWLFLNPTEYYLPYLILPLWIVGAAVWKGVPRRTRLAIAVLAFLSLAVRPHGQVSRVLEEFYVTRASEWTASVANDPAVVFLGHYGYEAQYLSPVPVKKLPNDPDARSEIRHAFIVEPGIRPTPEETRWLEEEFRLEKEIGVAKMYVRK